MCALGHKTGWNVRFARFTYRIWFRLIVVSCCSASSESWEWNWNKIIAVVHCCMVLWTFITYLTGRIQLMRKIFQWAHIISAPSGKYSAKCVKTQIAALIVTCANGIVNRTPTIASIVIMFLNLCLDHLFTNFLCGYTLLFLQAWRKRFDSRVPVHSSECSSKQVCRWRKTLYRTRVWKRKPVEMKWIELNPWNVVVELKQSFQFPCIF